MVHIHRARLKYRNKTKIKGGRTWNEELAQDRDREEHDEEIEVNSARSGERRTDLSAGLEPKWSLIVRHPYWQQVSDANEISVAALGSIPSRLTTVNPVDTTFHSEAKWRAESDIRVTLSNKLKGKISIAGYSSILTESTDIYDIFHQIRKVSWRAILGDTGCNKIRFSDILIIIFVSSSWRQSNQVKRDVPIIDQDVIEQDNFS